MKATLTEIYELFEWMALKDMTNGLLNDEPYDDLNNKFIAYLSSNRYSQQHAIQELVEYATETMQSHILEQWGTTPDKYQSKTNINKIISDTITNLNAYAILSLISTKRRTGQLQSLYESIQSDIKGLDKDEAKRVIYDRLKDGLESGYVQSNGYRWKLDRLIHETQRHLINDIYDDVMEAHIAIGGSNLVRIGKFDNPRSACAELQASGIISVAPRAMLKDSEQDYPNIFDSQHRYGYPDGHRGINCRHIWHALDGDDNTSKMYERIDRERRLFKSRRKKKQILLSGLLELPTP